jgi:hypothetical protein
VRGTWAPLARQPILIISVCKATTWKPIAEDYVFRIGPPTTAEGLRAVCLFMTASDEQLNSVADAMKALAAKPADPPPPATP